MDTRSLHMPLQTKQGWKAYVRDKYVRLMNTLAIRWADGQTVITDRMAKSLRIPSGGIWGIWPSGVDAQRFNLCSIERTWPTKVEPVKLAYIGALEWARNLMEVAVAVEMANGQGMSFQFILVGDGTQRTALETYAQGSFGHIAVIPPIPFDQVPDFLSQVHVGVLPFPDEEKFRVCSPIKLFEYMAAGLPILATRVCCHTDVLKDGLYVFWAETADVQGLLDALRALWQQRHTLKDLSTQAVSAAQAWTWHESAIKLKSALENGMIRCLSSTSSQEKTLQRQTPS
jgi:glycosyltransferase involved in cell wall biosynthesis